MCLLYTNVYLDPIRYHPLIKSQLTFSVGISLHVEDKDSVI